MLDKHFSNEIQKIVNRLKSKGDKGIAKVRMDLIELKKAVISGKLSGVADKAQKIHSDYLVCQKKPNHRVIRDKLNKLYLQLKDYRP
tara:strand:- start:201 stop:461 length:261 start_codon:yes stop_codon:yes gene_type:complete